MSHRLFKQHTAVSAHTASTLALCGSLLNLIIYTQTNRSAHTHADLEAVCVSVVTGCPISMETLDFQLLACQ